MDNETKTTFGLVFLLWKQWKGIEITVPEVNTTHGQCDSFYVLSFLTCGSTSTTEMRDENSTTTRKGTDDPLPSLRFYVCILYGSKQYNSIDGVDDDDGGECR